MLPLLESLRTLSHVKFLARIVELDLHSCTLGGIPAKNCLPARLYQLDIRRELLLAYYQITTIRHTSKE